MKRTYKVTLYARASVIVVDAEDKDEAMDFAVEESGINRDLIFRSALRVLRASEVGAETSKADAVSSPYH